MACSFDQCCGGDGASIDHRIEWPIVLLIENDRVESFAGRFDSNFAQDVIDAVIFEREAVDKRLGYGLNRKQMSRIACFIDLTIGSRECDAKKSRVSFTQLGNVGCDVAAEVIAILKIDFV